MTRDEAIKIAHQASDNSRTGESVLWADAIRQVDSLAALGVLRITQLPDKVSLSYVNDKGQRGRVDIDHNDLENALANLGLRIVSLEDRSHITGTVRKW